VTITADPSPTTGHEPERPAQRPTLLTVIIAALLIGLLFGFVSTKLAITVVLASAGIVIFGRLALRNFEGFVIACLVVRSALDSPKIHPSALAASTGVTSNSTASAALAVGLMVVSLLWWMAGRTDPHREPSMPSYLRLPLALFVAAGFASCITSSHVGTSANEALRIAAAVTMLPVAERLMLNLASVQRILIAVYASAIVPFTVAFLQMVSGGGRIIGGFSRIQGTFDHPNPFSIYLTFYVVSGTALFRYCPKRLRPAMAVLQALAWIFLLLTYTRSAWIATVVGVLVVGLLQSKRLVVAVLTVILVAAIAVPSIGKRFSDLGHTQYSGNVGNSLSWRIFYWGELLPLYEKSPVTGIGLKVIELSENIQKNAHDDFVRTLVETGALGFLAYIAMMVGLVRTSLRALKKTKVGLPRGIAVAFAALTTSFILLSIVSNIISQDVLLWYFFCFAAAAAAMSYHCDRDGAETVAELMAG
jgi:putative inorganic carbon (hco3(-)) transporter